MFDVIDRIFPVEAKDHSEIVSVWEASVRATHHFLSEEDIQFFKPLIRNQYLKAVTLFGMKNSQGDIVGFIGVSKETVEMLFISPDYRGKQIGKKLLLYAIESLHVTKVDVNEQNEQAVGFYQKAGFTIVGRSPVDSLGKPFPLLHLSLS